jgi:hypothetical protein
MVRHNALLVTFSQVFLKVYNFQLFSLFVTQQSDYSICLFIVIALYPLQSLSNVLMYDYVKLQCV